LDATNVLSPLVSIITSIGLDHQAYLGPTLTHIAREKGGIIKPGTPVVIGRMDEESFLLLREMAEEKKSLSVCYGKDFIVQSNSQGGVDYKGWSWQLPDIRVGLRGRFQYDNAAVGLAALEMIHSALPVPESCLRSGLASASWPGRLEVVSERPCIILDGAHNPQAMERLHAALPEILQGRRAKALFGVMRDKDWRAMLPFLAEIATEITVTRVQQPRAEDPEVLREALAPLRPTWVRTDARAACQQLMAEAKTDEAIVVCGSLFLVGEVYPLFSSAQETVSM
jgi:dihydrofolate synthase/folylpolyglutamate synthase